MEGLHLTADCFMCQCNPALLIEEDRLSNLVRQTTLQAGLTIVGEKFHGFTHPDSSPAGITGTLLLAESHVAIHTWPERQAVTLDVYVCNFENDNSAKAIEIVERLVTAFQPQQVSRQSLQRGTPSETTESMAIEYLSAHTAMQTQITEVVAEVQSPFQHIQIAISPEFGKIMRIDGAMMTSEKDEFYYHEALVHPAAITHGGPRTALIIGGGDGGSTEELLKYKSIQHITLCEIDEEVIKLSKQHLASIHQNAFDSIKVNIIHRDGFAYIEESSDQYDLILLDLTDPITANGSNLAQSCMTESFFQSCYQRLNEHGLIVLHLGSAFYHAERYQTSLARLRASFDHVQTFDVFIPLYGAMWGMAMAAKDAQHMPTQNYFQLSKQQINQRIQQLELNQLQFYNAELHHRLLA